MMQKIKTKLLLLLSILLLAISAAPAYVSAAADTQGSLCSGARNQEITANGGDDCKFDQVDKTTNHFIARVINIFSALVGVIAVIMIVVAGFRYITSGGSTERVTGAKNTLLYAVIGLIIVALAQVIVRFVLKQSTAG